MQYNVKTNKVETDREIIVNALKSEREQKEEIIKLAALGKNNYKYAKVYGEEAYKAFEIEMWFRNRHKTLISSLVTKDEKGCFKEFAWCE